MNKDNDKDSPWIIKQNFSWRSGNGWNICKKKKKIKKISCLGGIVKQAGCYVELVTFRFFNRCRQSSGSASKLAFFEAFPLQNKKKKTVQQLGLS